MIFCRFISNAAVGFSSFQFSSTCGDISPIIPISWLSTMILPVLPSMNVECVVSCICHSMPKLVKKLSSADLISLKLAFG
jgi:hypothetical protein